MATLNKFLRENKVSKMTKAERNAWYNALSKPEKAVAVCEDVLLQIKNEKYKMTSGTYVQLEIDKDITQRTVNDIFKKDALDEVLNAKSVTCNVCAMGSCLMSAVRLGNEVELSDVIDFDEWSDKPEPGDLLFQADSMEWEKLEEAFTIREYRAMEYMFEGSDVDTTFCYNEVDNAFDTVNILRTKYNEEYKLLKPQEKMIKMCKQIIKDKGYFFVEGVDLENKDK